ncbi:hypothetical protein BDW02DRAFT_320787 [Decorospora gaudefroyi]|uniref:Uncharacterized protein n=1 Tax=Decorospora gaudefroyi TaxID=184978 RepID=A0A6A5KF73_9PLEO|nr:hypothetical protein BDW02DRAFT_320787 [Decorospora gaudefroyi]
MMCSPSNNRNDDQLTFFRTRRYISSDREEAMQEKNAQPKKQRQHKHKVMKGNPDVERAETASSVAFCRLVSIPWSLVAGRRQGMWVVSPASRVPIRGGKITTVTDPACCPVTPPRNYCDNSIHPFTPSPHYLLCIPTKNIFAKLSQLPITTTAPVSVVPKDSNSVPAAWWWWWWCDPLFLFSATLQTRLCFVHA